MPAEDTMKQVRTLVARLPAAQVEGDTSVGISSITFDSRRVTEGALFVALRGGYADGHDYLESALASGAVAALVESDTPSDLTGGFQSVVRVGNTRASLAPLSAAFYDHPSHELSVVGVTGTDGKTTTCWYMRHMLESLGAPTGLVSTVAVQVPGQQERSSARQTTPESLDVQRTLREMVTAGATHAVLETTSHALETHRVDHCRFDIGVVTNVTREHLDFHGSIEKYRIAKGSLLRRVSSSMSTGGRGVVVLNADDEGARAIAGHAGDAHIIWYSTQDRPNSVVRATDIVHRATGSEFTLHIEGRRHRVSLPLLGSWNVSNCLAAIGALHALELDTGDIADTIASLRPVPGRMVNVDLGQEFTVLVDYAHTPESIRSVLTEARKLARGKVLVAFGSAGERDVEKRAIQGAVAAELADYAIFTSEDPRFEDANVIIEAIAQGAVEQGGTRGVDFDCIEDRRQAISSLISRARPGDIVILAGKGHERSMIYGAENRPWDEVEVAREALGQLGFGCSKNEGTLA